MPLRRLNLLDKLGILVDPATKEGQNDTIAQLINAVDKLSLILAGQVDGGQKTQIVDADGNSSHATQDINGAWHIGVHSIQHTIRVDSNSSSENLGVGGSFTGPAVSTSGAGTILVMLNSDQNCSVIVQQSDDGVNWDLEDKYTYTNYIDNFSQPVDVHAGFFRVIIENQGALATTIFRLSCRIKPISSVLPRSLCPESGCLKTVVRGLSDQHGFPVENTPTGEQRVASLSLLVGAPFEGDSLDTKFWNNVDVNGGSVTVGDGTATIKTGVTADGAEIFWSARRSQYIPGSSCRFRAVVQYTDAGDVDNKVRFGIAYGSSMPAVTDAAFLVFQDGIFKIHLYSGGILTEITSFNGSLGTSFFPGVEMKSYEIYFNVNAVYFTVDESLLHTYKPINGRWSGTSEFFIYADNINTNGHAVNHEFLIHSAGINRFGKFEAQHVSDSQQGTIASKLLKSGVGVLVSLSVSGVANNSVITLYDNTDSSGDILWTSGAMGAQATPFDVNINNIPFNIGLTLSITGANSNVTTVYF
jgi:hypothetical protein